MNLKTKEGLTWSCCYFESII